jgi:SAM-dependent methyltransferase
MVERARARAHEAGVDVEFRQADAHSLPFPAGSFDFVISECTLCLLDKERALGEMVRVARPGGCVGMHDICWREGAPRSTRARLAEIEGERPETLAGWRALFESVGLTEVQALDRSDVIPAWMKEMRRRIGLLGQARLALRILQRWGPVGLLRIGRSQRILSGRHMGYGLLIGRKPRADG